MTDYIEWLLEEQEDEEEQGTPLPEGVQLRPMAGAVRRRGTGARVPAAGQGQPAAAGDPLLTGPVGGHSEVVWSQGAEWHAAPAAEAAGAARTRARADPMRGPEGGENLPHEGHEDTQPPEGDAGGALSLMTGRAHGRFLTGRAAQAATSAGVYPPAGALGQARTGRTPEPVRQDARSVGGLYAALRRTAGAAESAVRRAATVGAAVEQVHAGVAAADPAALDLAFQRDARRYDGGFTLF